MAILMGLGLLFYLLWGLGTPGTVWGMRGLHADEFRFLRGMVRGLFGETTDRDTYAPAN